MTLPRIKVTSTELQKKVLHVSLKACQRVFLPAYSAHPRHWSMLLSCHVHRIGDARDTGNNASQVPFVIQTAGKKMVSQTTSQLIVKTVSNMSSLSSCLIL